MAGSALRRTKHTWTLWIAYSIAFLLLQIIECRRLSRAHDNHHGSHSSHNHGGSNKKHHRISQQNSDSDEEETTAGPPQIMGLKGLASAGVSVGRSTQTVPKCQGQDMRLEKVIQVTQYCEGETGESKNDTQGVGTGKSLCFTACMYKYLGLIGDDLMFTSDIDTVVVDIFPSIAHSLVKKAFRSCAKQSILPLSKSDNCTSFGPVKGCILRNTNNICNGDY